MIRFSIICKLNRTATTPSFNDHFDLAIRIICVRMFNDIHTCLIQGKAAVIDCPLTQTRLSGQIARYRNHRTDTIQSSGHAQSPGSGS